MARSEARIAVSIWSDPDFIALSPLAQRLFLFLISQPDLAHDGVLALRERRWSKAAAGLTPAQIRQHLAELAEARFVVIDEDTEELLVRSFIRRDQVYRQPNVLRSAANHLKTVTSPVIRAAIGEELRRVAAASDIGDAARAIVAEMLDALNPSGNPSPNPSGNPFRGGSGTPGEPCPEPARDIDEHSEIVPACETNAETPETDTIEQPTPITAGRKGSRNPSGNPSGTPSGNPPGERGIVTAVSSASPFPFPLAPTIPPTAERAALAVIDGELATTQPEPPTTTDALVAEWLRHCHKRPPRRVIGHISREVKAMLAEGIDPADVRRGLAAWHSKGLHPSTLPSVVNEVMNAGPARPAASISAADGQPLPAGTSNSRMNDAMRLAAHYAALDGTPIDLTTLGGTR